MEQTNYRFYKKTIIKYLSNNYVIVKSGTSLKKHKIVTKGNDVETSPSVILDELKKIFNLYEDKILKKIITIWSNGKITKKNWDWRINFRLPSGLLYYMDFVYPTQEVPFEPRLSVSSRYSSKKVSDKTYITINIQPRVPLEHIELDININNEKFKE